MEDIVLYHNIPWNPQRSIFPAFPYPSIFMLVVRLLLFSRLVVSLCEPMTTLSLIISQSLPKFMFIESVMPSNHLILCLPLLLLPSVFPSIRVFSNESALCIRWPKYWSFIFSISPSKEHPGLISFRMQSTS